MENLETKGKASTFPEVERRKSPLSYVLYKLDRTIAIVGIIAVAIFGMIYLGLDSKELGVAAIGGLVGYIGGRAGK